PLAQIIRHFSVSLPDVVHTHRLAALAAKHDALQQSRAFAGRMASWTKSARLGVIAKPFEVLQKIFPTQIARMRVFDQVSPLFQRQHLPVCFAVYVFPTLGRSVAKRPCVSRAVQEM